MNKYATKQNFKSVLDGKAVDTGIFGGFRRRSPVDGHCGAGDIKLLRWRTDAATFNYIESANDSNPATQFEWGIAA